MQSGHVVSLSSCPNLCGYVLRNVLSMPSTNITDSLKISLLDTDIRKLPAPVRRQRRKATSTTGTLSHGSPPQSSISTTSMTDGRSSVVGSRNGETSATSAPEFVEPPPLRAFRKKSRTSHSHYPPSFREASQQPERYWNEYDNPESDDEGYYIYVDPNAPVTYPGQRFFEGCASLMRRLFRGGKADETSQPLSPSDEGTSGDETVDGSVMGPPKSYGTMPTAQRQIGGGMLSGLFRSPNTPRHDDTFHRRNTHNLSDLVSEIQVYRHEREMTKRRLYSLCLAAAVVIDFILGVLVTTSRKNKRGAVDAVVIFGTICNLFLLGVAMLSMTTRQEQLGWVHQGLVFSVVVVGIVFDTLLLRWVLSP